MPINMIPEAYEISFVQARRHNIVIKIFLFIFVPHVLQKIDFLIVLLLKQLNH